MSYAGTQYGNGFGTYANRPTAGQAGRTYYATDTAVVFYDNGTAWQPVDAAVAPMTAVASGSFTWQNQGSCTATDQGSGIVLYAPNQTSANNARFLYISTPGTPYTITARFIYTGGLVNGENCQYGIGWGDGTKFHVLKSTPTGDGWNLNFERWTNTTTPSTSDLTITNADTTDHLQWYRITDNGTNRLVYISRDGVNFLQLATLTNTTHLTPTRVGIFMNPFLGDLNATLVSWKQT